MTNKTEHDHQYHDHSAHGHEQGHAAAAPDSAHKVQDPVCGMMVDPHTTAHKAEHAGRPYYFCSAKCREKFVAEPGRYIEAEKHFERGKEPVTEGTIYTCPMHPEIRQLGPGSCPLCGIALEPF